jgi:hypothetical protein
VLEGHSQVRHLQGQPQVLDAIPPPCWNCFLRIICWWHLYKKPTVTIISIMTQVWWQPSVSRRHNGRNFPVPCTDSEDGPRPAWYVETALVLGTDVPCPCYARVVWRNIFSHPPVHTIKRNEGAVDRNCGDDVRLGELEGFSIVWMPDTPKHTTPPNTLR